MHDTASSERNISPFLAKAGTPRTGEDRLPGYYCEQQKMWVVDTKQGARPIIDAKALGQLPIQTQTQEELDDDSYLALELMTKTHQQAESDDDTWPTRFGNLLQLVTKTDTVQEVDDNYSANQLLELVTKTKVQAEADDDDFQYLGFHY